jgi:hypothetical protein
LRGYGATAAAIYLAGDGMGQKTYSALGLAGAIGGSILGFQRGKSMTDAEAEAATTLSTLGAAAGFGAAATLSTLDNTDGRHAVGAMLGTGLVAYALGPNYARRASYTVTRGDVQMLSLSAIIGTAVAFMPIIPDDGDDLDDQVGFGILTGGLVAGALVGDRALVRNFDYSMSDATQVQLAAIGGGLMGGAIAILADPGAKGSMGMITGGTIIGAMAGHALANPPRARSGVMPTQRSSRLRFDPSAVALAAAKTPGRHAVLSLAF